MINYRLVLRDSLAENFPDIKSEAAGNLGALLILRSMVPGALAPQHTLTEAIALFGKAKEWLRTTMSGEVPIVFEVNLALAYFQRYRTSGSAGDLMLARLVMNGISDGAGSELSGWISDVRQVISAPQPRSTF